MLRSVTVVISNRPLQSLAAAELRATDHVHVFPHTGLLIPEPLKTPASNFSGSFDAKRYEKKRAQIARTERPDVVDGFPAG